MKTLLDGIDCNQNYSADRYFSCGETKIVSTSAGQYREAEGRPLARFGYRFQIKNVGKPHLAVVYYPDDKRRFMIINDGTSYDLSSGIISGHIYPISNTMQELHQIFWPRWTDCSICFMTWGYNEPAAVQKIEIYELDGLPAADISNRRGYRELGIQYEDPCGTGSSEGAMNFDTWLDHVVDYAKFTGQSLLAYPICWYHGPCFPSNRERSDASACVIAEDRKQYVVWTDQPDDWPAKLLERFEQEGLKFQASLTMLRLSSLMKQMNIDLPAIQAGAETINSMLWCNNVQSGTNDWTLIYNTLNYPKLLEKPDPLASTKDFDWTYGEKTGQPYHPGPIFNPLHPSVQKSTIGLVREIAERYGKYSTLDGISLNIWGPTIVWFGSLHSGYDDYTSSLFEKETGIRIPVEANDPHRFSKRYEFLTFKCRSEWIDWRCRKIHELIRKLRDMIVAVRPDLRLVLTLWCEPFIPGVYGNGGPEHQIHARIGTLDIFKEGGIDPSLYADDSNIEFDFQLEGGGRDRTSGIAEEALPEAFFMFRDHDFLDRDLLNSMAKLPRSGAFIFNAWHEAWGKYKWFKVEAGDINVPGVSSVYGQREHVHTFRANSEYPKDGFWWNSQSRITAAYPPGPHFMEQYAHAVAELDALRITRGGLFLEKGHSAEIEKFARAYRTLPAEKFETVGSSTDPVAMRTLVKNSIRYLYLVNREYYPVEVEMQMDPPIEKIMDLAEQKEIEISSPWKIKLSSYELKSFSLLPETLIQKFRVCIPAEIEQQLTAETQKTLKQIQQVQSSEHFIAGLDQVQFDIELAFKEHRWSWLRHLLMSYPVCKCAQMVKNL
jgi:hypothetical protein